MAQQAHRMPEALLGAWSMRTAPFSSSSPWLVMYDTGSPSCHGGRTRNVLQDSPVTFLLLILYAACGS